MQLNSLIKGQTLHYNNNNVYMYKGIISLTTCTIRH